MESALSTFCDELAMVSIGIQMMKEREIKSCGGNEDGICLGWNIQEEVVSIHRSKDAASSMQPEDSLGFACYKGRHFKADFV